MFQQSVYWFLGVLFALFLVLAWIHEASSRLRASAVRVEQPRPRLFVAFIALTAAGSALLAPWLGVDDWVPVFPFIVQPARIVFYVGYFALGIYAERRGWFGATGFRPDPGPWGWGCVLAGVAYLTVRLSGPMETAAGRALAAALFAVFCLAAVIAGIAVFQRWLNRSGRGWQTLAANSFGIYYVHPLILYPLAYLLLDLGVPAIVKATILVLVTLAGSLAVSALVLKRLPGVRRAF